MSFDVSFLSTRGRGHGGQRDGDTREVPKLPSDADFAPSLGAKRDVAFAVFTSTGGRGSGVSKVERGALVKFVVGRRLVQIMGGAVVLR